MQNPGFLPDHPQKWTTCSCCHARHIRKISERSVHNFLSYLANRQTNRQTDKNQQKHYLLGGGKYQKLKTFPPWEKWRSAFTLHSCDSGVVGKKLECQNVAIFTADGQQCCRFLTEESTSAQKINFFPKFLQNGEFPARNIAFLKQNFSLRRHCPPIRQSKDIDFPNDRKGITALKLQSLWSCKWGLKCRNARPTAESEIGVLGQSRRAPSTNAFWKHP